MRSIVTVVESCENIGRLTMYATRCEHAHKHLIPTAVQLTEPVIFEKTRPHICLQAALTPYMGPMHNADSMPFQLDFVLLMVCPEGFTYVSSRVSLD